MEYELGPVTFSNGHHQAMGFFCLDVFQNTRNPILSSYSALEYVLSKIWYDNCLVDIKKNVWP